MKKITFITGNEGKAAELGRLLGFSLAHRNIDIEEIQELDLEKLITHKATVAYGLLKSPVLVEDTSLEFEAMGKLPGPFIKWFLKSIGNVGLCRILDSLTTRDALFTSMFAYYDGKRIVIFKKSIRGVVSNIPKGQNGFGWDPIFIPVGSTKTRGEMTHEEQDRYTPRKDLVVPLKEFLNKE